MGSSKAQTVGYRYSLGAHLALCHGPVDAIREIRVDDRTAWQLRVGTTVAGTGAGAQAVLGTAAGMSATAGGAETDFALVRFPGTLAGVKLGASYELALAADGTSVTVTVQSVSFSGEADQTTWSVTPKATSFAAQSVTVKEAGGGAVTAATSPSRIRIDKPALFGGDSREGGIVGDVDVLMGAPDQGANDYLAARAGAEVPGYRGLCSLVLRQVYLGLNPYLKPWAVRLTRILKAQDGDGQWYPETAVVYAGNPESSFSLSGPDTANVPAAAHAGDSIAAAFDAGVLIDGFDPAREARFSLVSGRFEAWLPFSSVQLPERGWSARLVIFRDADPADYVMAGPEGYFATAAEALAAFAPVTLSGAASYRIAFLDPAPGETSTGGVSLKVEQLLLSPNGEWEAANRGNIGVLGHASMQEMLDSGYIRWTSEAEAGDETPWTCSINVFALSSGSGQSPPYFLVYDRSGVCPIFTALYLGRFDYDPYAAEASEAGPDPDFRPGFTIAEGPDMNPAHIVRECLTNADWGLGHGEADIGPSFTSAADRLFAEGFGLSLLWQQESSIEDFLSEVLKHIDACLHVDRRSGRWELRLIRGDDDPDDVPVLDEANVVDWGELGRREGADLVNSVTVRFTDARTDATGTVSVTDTALVQLMGEVVSATIDYPGVRRESLAVRLAERDLRALSAPLLSGEITVNRTGAELEPGDVVRLVSPRRGLEGVLVRIVEIDHGDGRANGVRLKIAEDVFALGETALVGGAPAAPGSLTVRPKPLVRRFVAEAPYWLLVQELGHVQADALLAEDPDAGALVAAGERPSADALSAQLWTDLGQGFALEQSVEFAPTALLAADISDDPTETELAVDSWSGMEAVAIGTLAAIGDELVRIDGVSASSITVGRGCLDTVPLAHPAGTPVICWQALADATEARFAAGEVVAAKLLPETGFGVLPLAQVPEDEVVMASRAIRPLPPGRLQADGSWLKTLPDREAVLTWAHRDRLAQTSAVFDSYTAPDIGPEPGVAYEVRIHWVDAATGATLEPAAAVIPVGQATGYTLVESDYPVPPFGIEHAAIRVRAVRDDHDDRAFRELRVPIGGYVHVAEQELTLVFLGSSVDVVAQELVVASLGPAVDVLGQELVVAHRGPSVDVLAQELIVEILP